MQASSLAALLLVSVCLLQSHANAAVGQRCQHDHTGWAEGVTAQEQAEYIDEMLGHETEWGELPAYDVLAVQLPLCKYWQKSMLHLVGSLAGLKRQEATRVIQDLNVYMDETLQYLAVAYHCCGLVHNSDRQKAEWEGSVWWPALLVEACPRHQYNTRLARAYALAQAHAGPSRVHCGQYGRILLRRTRHNTNLAYGLEALEKTMNLSALNGARTVNVAMLVKILVQASEPAVRGTPYNNLVDYIEVLHDFESEIISEGWYDTGIPDYLEFAGGTPTIHHALVWVLRYGIAVLTLENFHNHTTRASDMAECRNIRDWFGEKMLFSAQGLLCVCASRSQPLNTDGIQADIGQLVPVEKWLADSLLADKAFVEECHGWAECSAAFANWGFLFVCHVGLLVNVAYLCWRPDLLIFWRESPTVRTPSYAGFVRQVMQQRFTAKAARQVAAESTGKKPPDSSKEGYAAYAAHIFWQCWLPRVRFVGASFAPGLLVSLFVSPVRLAVSGLRVGVRLVSGFSVGMQLLGGTAKELLSGMVKVLSRICY
jgi:hypothetical protein